MSDSQEITSFSYDSDHVLHHDTSSLKYYYTPPIGASLSEGFDTFRKIDDTNDEHLDGLLCSLVELEKRRTAANEPIRERNGNNEQGSGHEALAEEEIKADIITWRGMMTKVCPWCAVYLRDCRSGNLIGD